MRRTEIVDGGFAAPDELDGPRALGASWMRALGPLEDVGHRSGKVQGDDFFTMIFESAKLRLGRYLNDI